LLTLPKKSRSTSQISAKDQSMR